MRTRATLLHPSPAESGTTRSHLVLTLVGEDTGSQRPRLGVVPVVDRSGSMASADKLGIVTRALGYLSGYLSDEDHLALVAFDTDVDTLVPATVADPSGTAAFTEALGAVAPRASTNLSGGIVAGLAAAAAMPAAALVRVIVLTDGRANHGATRREDLLALLADIPAHVSVSFLGVGTDCDHDLLGALAAAGRGSYGFIEAADRAADVLGTEVGGLLETEVHRLAVTVAGRSKYLHLDGVLGTTVRAATADRVEVEVGQLLVGQTRHLVLPVTLTGPGRRHARPVTVAEVTVSGVIDDTDVSVDLLPKAHFGGPDATVDDDVVGAVELAQVAAAQQLAEAAAAAGNFTDARTAFANLDVRTGAALGLSRSLSMNYADAGSYDASATLRSSSSHALAGSLAGSGDAFDALAARTIGSYTTSGQRDVATATSLASLAVTTSHGGSGKSDLATRIAATLLDDARLAAPDLAGETDAADGDGPDAETTR